MYLSKYKRKLYSIYIILIFSAMGLSLYYLGIISKIIGVENITSINIITKLSLIILIFSIINQIIFTLRLSYALRKKLLLKKIYENEIILNTKSNEPLSIKYMESLAIICFLSSACIIDHNGLPLTLLEQLELAILTLISIYFLYKLLILIIKLYLDKDDL